MTQLDVEDAEWLCVLSSTFVLF